MGINLRDVIKLQWSNVHDDEIFYYRSKTFRRRKVKRKNTVLVDKRTTAIIDKYKGRGSYIFNVLEDSMTEEQKYRSGKNFIRKINQHLKRVAVELEISTEISTSVWLNKHFGKDQAKDDRLAKLKYVYNTEGIINNLKEVVKTNCVDLIIIDSYADLFTGSMNNSNEVRSFLNMYNNIANEFGVTVIFLHHTKKASAGMAPNKNSILGSQGFEAKMRSVLMLTKDDSDESLRHLCVIKNNYIPESSKSMSYVLRFNEYLSFENTGDQVPLNELASEEWIPMAKQMKDDGKSYRQISGELSEKGHQVSKSSIQRKLL